MVPHRPAQTKGGFIGLRRLSNSQVIPLQNPIALYQTRRNEVTYRRRTIPNKQANKTLHHSSASTEHS